MNETYVGVDVSKERLDVFVHPNGERISVDNRPKGHGELAEKLSKAGPTRIVLEATGGFEMAVTATLVAAKLSLRIVLVATPRAPSGP